MNTRSHQKRVLALDVHPSRFGYVVFEGPDELLDWGVRSFRDGVNAVRIPPAQKLAALLDDLSRQQRNGHAPDIDAVGRQHPDLAAELRQLWAAAQLAGLRSRELPR